MRSQRVTDVEHQTMPFDTPITLTPAAYAADALRRLGDAGDADKKPANFVTRAKPEARRSAIARVWRLLLAWRRSRSANQTMRELAHLDDRLLADIGLVRGDPVYTALAADWYVGTGDRRPRFGGQGRSGWDHL
jgi:uncharacterized protein YjiS (DUF1127 family)